MDLPVLFIITSSKCGACTSMRGKEGWPQEKDGTPAIPGGHSWSTSFFRKLLTGGMNDGKARFRVMEVHFPSLSPRSVEDIEELTEYNLTTNNKIATSKFTPSSSGLVSIAVNKSKKKILGAFKFKEWIRSHVPDQLMNYLYYFPGWCYISGEEYTKALRGAGSMYAHVNGCTVKEIDSVYRVSGRGGRIEDPVALAHRFISEPEKLVPPKEEEVVPAQESKEAPRSRSLAATESGGSKRVGPSGEVELPKVRSCSLGWRIFNPGM